MSFPHLLAQTLRGVYNITTKVYLIINIYMSPHKTNSHGFTLLEILLVVGIIAILAGIVIVAINPARQLAQARNTERRSDIKQIKSAMEQFYIDKGYYPASTTLSATTTLLEVCDTGASSSPTGITCTGKLNLSELVPVYITAIPKDPQATTTNSAGYKVAKDASNKLITTAPQAELSVFIAIGTSTPSAYNGTLGNGLILHYKMNDTSGTTVVDTKGNDGTASRNLSNMATSGLASNAFSFNKSQSDKITTSFQPSSGSGSFSVSFWMKSPQLSSSQEYFALAWGNVVQYQGIGFGWEYQSSKIIFDKWGAGTDSLRTTSRMDDGSWHHVVGTYNGTTAQLFVDNVSIGTKTWPLNIQTNSLIIGDRPTYSGFYSGLLDDLRFYNRVLTTGEIAELTAGTESE